MVRIATCQLLPSSDINNRKVQMNYMLQKAENERIDFICFPECFLTGYYAERELAYINSIEAKALNEWLDAVKNYSSTIIVGFTEREGDKLFNSAVIIENGKIIGIQRKHYLYYNYFSSGISFRSFQSKGITFGVVICLDTNYFEPSRLLALQGATILFSPMCNRVPLGHRFSKRPSYYSHLVSRSFENRCWLVTSDWVWPNDGTSICPGHSLIYDPDGKEILRSQDGKEQLVVLEIDSGRLFKEKGQRVYGSPLLTQKMVKLD